VTTEAETSGHHHYRWLWLAGLLLALMAAVLLGRNLRRSTSAPHASAPTPPPVPVVAAVVQARDVNVTLTGLGTVTPLQTVTVRSRVDGQLMRVAFVEGDLVKKGQLLAEIDPRPFAAQLAQAEGVLARDRALLDNARIDLGRYQDLIGEGAIPRQQLDTQAALVRQYAGNVRADEGQVATARVQVVYTRITAPLAGRVGLRLVDPGNIVHASDTTGIVVITQLQPITVVFTLPEDNVQAVLQKLASGQPLRVDALDREQRQTLSTGTLLTLDNQVDPTTGTVRLKATFPNPDQRLFPNQFVNARLLLEVHAQTPAVPATAIQRGAQGPYVYVVQADRTVGLRPLSVGVTDGDWVEVQRGLVAGERVVVEGADRLRAGSRVAVDQGRGGP
jgi:multidrug efflux system membrane fusion protein